MSRAVTADHVLFDECIGSFRRSEPTKRPIIEGESSSFLLTSFEIDEPWALPNCTLYPSRKIILSSTASAFICRIENPEWVGMHNSHLYGIALATLISFVTGKLCKSTRNDYFSHSKNLRSEDVIDVALTHPVLIAGPGANQVTLATKKKKELQEALSELMTRLHSVPYKKYVQLMQAIRLVHLSLLNKREDFGLAYFLIVAAIESVTQNAIKNVRKEHSSEQAWKIKATDDPVFAELFSVYADLNSKELHLKERYIEFICKFAPIENWEELVPHPRQDLADHLREVMQNQQFDHVANRSWDEKYPADLSLEQVHKILGDSYKYRSCFVHRGEQPPHRQPTSSNRFFQEIQHFDGEDTIEKLLPNFELLLGIAQCSITRWAASA